MNRTTAKKINTILEVAAENIGNIAFNLKEDGLGAESEDAQDIATKVNLLKVEQEGDNREHYTKIAIRI